MQLFPSVTKQLYDPAKRFDAVFVLGGPEDHTYVYGELPVPPVETLNAPVSPLQSIGDNSVISTSNGVAGWLT